MLPVLHHEWNLTPEAARELQARLAQSVIREDRLPVNPQFVAGVDVAYATDSDKVYAGVAVLDVASLELVETRTAVEVGGFPYLPGLFSFREIPPILKALALLESPPDLIVCDAQGLAHPMRFGMASHLGLVLDVPTIGCAKKRLIGDYPANPRHRGERADLMDAGEVVGSVLCTQNETRPVFASIGHRVSLETACAWILKLAPTYRLPETTRKANELVNLLRQVAK